MPLLTCLSRTWSHIQGNLFPCAPKTGTNTIPTRIQRSRLLMPNWVKVDMMDASSEKEELNMALKTMPIPKLQELARQGSRVGWSPRSRRQIVGRFSHCRGVKSLLGKATEGPKDAEGQEIARHRLSIFPAKRFEIEKWSQGLGRGSPKNSLPFQ
jgi:hypothetical protein